MYMDIAQEIDEEEKEIAREQTEKIQLGEALNKLELNEDFKLVLDSYLNSTKIEGLASFDKVEYEETLEKTKAIGHFKKHLQQIQIDMDIAKLTN